MARARLPGPLLSVALLSVALATVLMLSAGCGTAPGTSAASSVQTSPSGAASGASVAAGPVIGPSPDAFSFIVVGDTTAPGFLPFTEAQWGLAAAIVERMAGDGMGDAGAGSIVMEPAFDPASGLLTHLRLSAPGRATREIDYRAGWPVRVVEDDGGVRRQIMRRAGQTWVYRSVAEALAPGRAAFLLHAGDLVFWGLQGRTADGSPYWRDVRERLLDRISPARLRVRVQPQGAVTELSGRVLACPGNHETWGDPELDGLRGALPALGDLGMTAERPVWAFDVGETRFVALDSEAFAGPGTDDRPLDVVAQFEWLRARLDQAVAAGLERVVVLFHRPSFTLGRSGGLPAAVDPHLVLRDYADELDIVVFNGHVHTTEAFEVEGVRYVVCGAGGSEQELGVRTPPTGYPADQYWRGAPREEEYAFVEVRVSGDAMRLFVHRMRPGTSVRPEEVELFAE